MLKITTPFQELYGGKPRKSGENSHTEGQSWEKYKRTFAVVEGKEYTKKVARNNKTETFSFCSTKYEKQKKKLNKTTKTWKIKPRG